MPLILLISLSFISSIILNSLITFPFHPLIFPLLIILLGITAFLFRYEKLVGRVAIALSFFLLGVICYQQAVPDGSKNWVNYYNDHEVVLEGLIVQPPDATSRRMQLTVAPAKISLPDNTDSVNEIDNSQYAQPAEQTKLKGRVLVTIRGSSEDDYQYGDIIRVLGELEEPPELEDFSYKEYLNTKGIYSVMSFPEAEVVERGRGRLIYSLLYNLRDKLCRKLERYFPEPHASLLAGIILGVKRSFSDSFYEAMRRTSVLHVIVASGVNITIVMNSVAAMMAKTGIKKGRQLPVLGLAIFAYAVIAGFEPPIVRALITGVITYLSLVTGRCKHGLLSLFVAASVMLFFSPLLYKSLSFQLSFGASAALLLIYPYFRSGFSFLPHQLGESLGTTVAVQLALLPFLMYKFSTFSLVAPLANMLVLPAVEGLMLAGAAWLFISFLLPSVVVSLLSWFLWLFIEFFVRIVNYFGNFSWASVEGVKISLWMVAAYYAGLVVILWWLGNGRKRALTEE